MMANYRKYYEWAWLLALLVFPFVLWAIPADFFDNSKVTICPSRFLFDVECLGCGMTRSIMHLHHFELEDGVYYHTAGPIVYLALIGVWGLWVYKSVQRLNILPSKLKPAPENKH